MVKTETIIAVKDVPKSSKWYQQLLGCKSAHGGDTFEILTNNKNEQLLSLHKWDDYGHPTMINPNIKTWHGFIICFFTSLIIYLLGYFILLIFVIFLV